MVVHLNPSEDRPEIWRGKVGEIANIEFDGTAEKYTTIYGVKYRNEQSVPCFREQDLMIDSSIHGTYNNKKAFKNY